MLENILKSYYDLKKHKSDDLEYFDSYFTDLEEKKYLFVYSIFNSFKELEENWEDYQNEDIALYLQNELYKGMDLRWDIYYLLFYKSQSEINQSKIYDIERNKYICRKLVIPMGNEKELINNLNLKLPISKNFYNLSQSTKSFSEKDFYEKLIKKMGIKNSKLSKNEIFNPLENKDEIRKLAFEESDTL
ncbi:ABC-three component system middle component 1 [Halanaerobium sp. ST460_2HS_T2]|uniref:ABC-three component system middle component 1 n=1 Tax=Halanaerobium sp. ST460_2HS_T2 TaxID=2183914 RepID=UPI000DF21B7C|nr:ABC-three component system middle component 1 [Halanaerobium sp. ST460_2HS_T2]RCW53381.1 hypothetical protein DFR80_12213 [Halanaerobium sp. ST460_2HS_T2]